MPTYVKMGLYKPPFTSDEDSISPEVYIDESIIQVLTDTSEFVVQFTYEELRGLMAIMAAEQEKKHLFIKAQIKGN